MAASETRWTYRSRQVTSIKNSLDSYIKTFSNMVYSRDPKWKDSVPQASGYLDRLESFDFNYWLDVFEQIFAQTDVLYKKLQSRNLDIGWAGPAVEDCKNAIKRIFDNADEIYNTVASQFDPPTVNKRKRKRNRIYDHFSGSSGGETLLSHKDETRRLLKEVIDKLLRCLGDRFNGIDQFKFLALLKVEKFSEYRAQFPDEAFDHLKRSPYSGLFDLNLLRRQLTAIYRRDHLPEHFDDMVRENFELGLHEVVSTNQFSKLAELCLTFPLTVSSAERSFSALKRIKDRLRSTMADERLCNLSLISVEKKIAKSLNLDHIIDRFAAMKDRRIKLIYKV